MTLWPATCFSLLRDERTCRTQGPTARSISTPLALDREVKTYLLLSTWNMAASRADVGGQNVDAMLCSVRTGTQKGQASRSHSLRMRLGVVTKTAIVVEF